MNNNYQSRIRTRNGTPFTTSLAVSEDFTRSHHAVVVDILQLHCTPTWFSRNFREAGVDVVGRMGRQRLMHYEISRDGFLLLTSSHSDERLVCVREGYLEAFDRANRAKALTPPLLPGGLVLRQLALYQNLLVGAPPPALRAVQIATPERSRTAGSQGSQVFDFGDKPIRTSVDGDEVWFVAKDVFETLELSWNGSRTLAQIPNDWREVVKFTTPSEQQIGRGGGEQKLLCINFKALCKVAFRSNKPEADRFTNWAAEVIDTIRKTGTYTLPAQAATPLPQSAYRTVGRSGFVLSPDLYIRLFLANNRERVAATLIWLLMHENALERIVSLSLRELNEMSNGELSRNGVFKCIRRLMARGVLLWHVEGTRCSTFILVEEVLAKMVRDIEPSTVALLGDVKAPVFAPRSGNLSAARRSVAVK